MYLQWWVPSAAGPVRGGVISAPSRSSAQRQLRQRGIAPLRLQRLWHWDWGPPQACVRALPRELGVLLRCGLPLEQALRALTLHQTSPQWSWTLGEIRKAVAAGQTLHHALRQQSGLFDELTLRMVEVGERGGVLLPVLGRLETWAANRDRLNTRLRTAVRYPASVVCLALVVVAVICSTVVPQFEETFRAFGMELPVPTQLLLDFAHALRQPAVWWALAMLAVGGCWLGNRLRRNPTLRAMLLRGLWRIGWVRRLWGGALEVRLLRGLSSLYGAGMPLADALRSCATLMPQGDCSVWVSQAWHAVSNGQTLHAALQAIPFLSVQWRHAVALGEDSGALQGMLEQVADAAEHALEQQLQAVSAWAEPILLTAVAALIGGIVLALYLPILQMGQLA